jgi:hypothetical protein
MNRIGAIVNNHKFQLAFFGLVGAVALPIIFNTVYDTYCSSLGLYFNYSSLVMDGGIPYRDFALEYPPFSLFFIMLPRLFFSSYDAYAVAFQVEIFIFILLGLYLIYRIARDTGSAPWEMMAAYTAVILAVGPIITRQYDIFPAVMVLLSLYFFWKGRHKTSWVILALAATAKIYPVFIAPVFLLYYLRNRQYRRIGTGVITFAITGLAVALPFLITAPEGLWNMVSYHAERGVQLESTYSAIALIGEKMGWASIYTDFSAGSWNIAGPLADNLAAMSTILMPFFLLVGYWFIYRRLRPGESRIFELGAFSLLIAAVVLITGKVLSPQYLIWLLPLLPLAAGLRYATWAVFIAIGGMSYYVFPWNYIDLVYLETWPVAVLIARDILLVLMTVMLGVAIYRSRRGRQELPENAEG